MLNRTRLVAPRKAGAIRSLVFYYTITRALGHTQDSNDPIPHALRHDHTDGRTHGHTDTRTARPIRLQRSGIAVVVIVDRALDLLAF